MGAGSYCLGKYTLKMPKQSLVVSAILKETYHPLTFTGLLCGRVSGSPEIPKVGMGLLEWPGFDGPTWDCSQIAAYYPSIGLRRLICLPVLGFTLLSSQGFRRWQMPRSSAESTDIGFKEVYISGYRYI